MQNCMMYLQINKKKYDNNLAKIGFVLALMNDRDAATWKEQLLNEAMERALAANAKIDLGTYDAFEMACKETFELHNVPGDALEQMKALRMKTNDSIDDHFEKFKMLVTALKIGTTSPTIIDLFYESIFVAFQSRLLTLEKPPTTLNEWYTRAHNLDNALKKMQKVTQRNFKTKKGTGTSGRKFTLPKCRDPNTMDIDALSMENKDEMMKAGKCFYCEQTRHLAKDCPKKKGKQKEEAPKYEETLKKWKQEKSSMHILGAC